MTALMLVLVRENWAPKRKPTYRSTPYSEPIARWDRPFHNDNYVGRHRAGA